MRSRERQREDTRQRIYDAALEIFRRDGFENARVDDVAKAAGVSHGTFYFHFATKDEVLIQCLRASEVRVGEAIDGVPADGHVTQALDAACAMIAKEWEGDPVIFKDVGMVALRYLFRGEVAQMVTDGTATPASDGPQSHVGRILAARFTAAAERGELTRILPPHVLADLCLLNIFAATLAWSANPTARPLSMMLHGVVRIWLDGVRGAVV